MSGPPPDPADATLRIEGLTKRFGGVTALDGLSMSLPRGSATAVIGPNGAGKSTVLKVIAGVHRPSSGSVHLGGRRLDQLAAHHVPRHGVALAHQVPRPFRGLTVRDNVLIAARAAASPSARHGVEEVLGRCGLAGKADRPAASLGVLDLKRLEVARALATLPVVLLLDEVAAGLAGRELDEAIDLIRGLHADGLTVLLVEHVERVVRSIVERVLVLDWGELIADGTPAEVAADARVREVYLGAGHTPTAPRRDVRAGSATAPVLELTDVSAGYSQITALRGVDITVSAGEVVAVLGSNGAGKSTLCSVISGLLPARSGTVALAGRCVTRTRPHDRTRAGIAHCPEGRRLFADLSVAENLGIGAPLRLARAEVATRTEDVLGVFPALRDKLTQRAGTLSGGQQQMVAIGRALMSRPSLLVCDEVSLGLAPLAVDALYDGLEAVRETGTAVLLVEQNVARCLTFADRVYVLDRGRISYAGAPGPLSDPDALDAAYFGDPTAHH